MDDRKGKTTWKWKPTKPYDTDPTERRRLNDEELAGAIEELKKAHAGNRRSCESIGRFIYLFSQLEFTMRYILAVDTRLPKGLFDVMLGDLDFAKLCNKLDATKKFLWAADQTRYGRYSKLVSRARALNDQRVIIAHATWSPSGEGLSARKVNSKLVANDHLQSASAIDKYAQEASDLMSAFIFAAAEPHTKKAARRKPTKKK